MEVVLDPDGILRERLLVRPQVVEYLDCMTGLTATPYSQPGCALRLVLPADGGLSGGAGLADDEALMLKGEEAEELVVDEGSADGEAGVVVAHLLFGGGERDSWRRRARCG